MTSSTFTLACSQADFTSWLRQYVEPTLGLSFETPRGSLKLTSVSVMPPTESGPAITIDGLETLREALDTLPARPPLFETITFGEAASATPYPDKKHYWSGLISIWLKPEGKKLAVSITSDLPALMPYYVNLIVTMCDCWQSEPDGLEQGAFASMPPVAAARQPEIPSHPERPSGRPPNIDDEWAWCEVRLQGRNQKQVYKEWLSRIGERAGQLADPLDSFRKAIKPGRLAGKYGRNSIRH